MSLRVGRNHLPDGLHLGFGQLLRHSLGTRRSIHEATRLLALPRVIARGGQFQDAQHDSQGQDLSGPLNALEQRLFSGPVGNAIVGEGEPRDLQQHDEEAKQGDEGKHPFLRPRQPDESRDSSSCEALIANDATCTQQTKTEFLLRCAP